jgi:hypothetical protein
MHEFNAPGIPSEKGNYPLQILLVGGFQPIGFGEK